MVEVLWVAIFGMVLAWLQASSAPEEEQPVIPEDELPTEDAWARWESEIHDWRER